MGKKSREKREREKAKSSLTSQSDRESLDWWLVAALILLAFIAFARTIPYEFVFDDEGQILRNPWIRGWSNLGQIFSSDVWRFRNANAVTNYYRPLHMVLYMLGYSLSGLNPHGYHVLNILVHCLCTVLVTLIGLRLTESKHVSVAAGLLFALHPIHAESVTWIAAVTDPLCAVFYFGALYFYLRDNQQPARRLYQVLVLGLYFGALLSKEMAFTFPVIAVWMDWVLHRRFRWSRYAMFAAVFAFYVLLRVTALTRFLIHQVPVELDAYSRLLTTIVIMARYLLKLFVPHDISAFHPFNPITSVVSSEFGCAVLTLAVLGLLSWLFRSQREMLFLLGFCILSLVPLLDLTLVSDGIIQDRYLYIPSLGACLLIPLTATQIWQARPEHWPWSGLRIGSGLLGFLLVGYGFLLWKTTFMWKDNLTLYSETLKRSPGAVRMANNLARYYFTHGEYDKSDEWYRKALGLWNKSYIKDKPNLAAAYVGLGGIYFHQQKIAQARDYFMKAFEVEPTGLFNLQSLGLVYTALGDYKKALEYSQQALDMNPRNEVTYNNLAWLYYKMGKYQETIANARKALEIAPTYGNAYVHLARAYAALGMKAEARRSYKSASDLDPSKSGLVETELKLLEPRAP